MLKKNVSTLVVGICLLLVIITLSYFLWHSSLIKANSGTTNYFFINNWGNTSREVTVELFTLKTSLYLMNLHFSTEGNYKKSIPNYAGTRSRN
jgi:hypothetical protein